MGIDRTILAHPGSVFTAYRWDGTLGGAGDILRALPGFDLSIKLELCGTSTDVRVVLKLPFGSCRPGDYVAYRQGDREPRSIPPEELSEYVDVTELFEAPKAPGVSEPPGASAVLPEDPGLANDWPWFLAAPMPPWSQLYPWLGLLLADAREDRAAFADAPLQARDFINGLIRDMEAIPLMDPPSKKPPEGAVAEFFERIWEARGGIVRGFGG